MFFAGGTFGSESEARDANRRPTGRRHQARDMAEVQAAIDANHGVAKATAEGFRHAAAQKQMSAGPSFLDRMYEQNSAVVEASRRTRRHASAPTDHLNIFSWQDSAPATRAPEQSLHVAANGPRASRPVNVNAAAPTAEDRRAEESKKFEAHLNSAFLRFSDDPKGQRAVNAGNCGAHTGDVTGKPVVSAPSENGMMGSLMREHPHKPRGRRGQPPATTGNRLSAPEESGVAGFPGMGQRSIARAVPHLTRKPVQSNVSAAAIPQSAQRKGCDGSLDPREPPARGLTSKPKCIPPYYIDDEDYEDRHPTNAYEAESCSRQPCIQEIEMHSDGGYDDNDQANAGSLGESAQPYAPARNEPEWLRDSSAVEDSGELHARSPLGQQRQYKFDAGQQQFYESDVPPYRRSQHH
ncbi:hypothetical protein LSCM1_03125 [Leishmania martiniquensis]|uniref:Uncharacterized protein n=1 Tax=Leishmania martiniquensis TaxID=1580590 RepID=A0A836GYM5_9TRYP|nr:hypothetical protein LSCM1_03125 [Leishmania martiniquensis]